MIVKNVPTGVLLHCEGRWELLDASSNRYSCTPVGWKSVIKHHCPNVGSSPYWMLIKWHNSPTICTYCHEDMPASIVCLFKLHNIEAMR